MMGEIVPHSMKNLSVGSMGGRVWVGARPEEGIAPIAWPCALLRATWARTGGNAVDWFLERAAHSAPVSHADRHMCACVQGPASPFVSPCVIILPPGRCGVAVD